MSTVLSLLLALAQSIPVIGTLADQFADAWSKYREAEAAARLTEKKARNENAVRSVAAPVSDGLHDDDPA